MTSGSVNPKLTYRKGSVMVLSTNFENLVNFYLLEGADVNKKRLYFRRSIKHSVPNEF